MRDSLKCLSLTFKMSKNPKPRLWIFFAYFNIRYIYGIWVCFLVSKYIWGRVKLKQMKIIVINERKVKSQTSQLSSFVLAHNACQHKVGWSGSEQASDVENSV